MHGAKRVQRAPDRILGPQDFNWKVDTKEYLNGKSVPKMKIRLRGVHLLTIYHAKSSRGSVLGPMGLGS